MSAPQIHGKRRTFSASAVLEAAGKAIGEIKQQDGLTWGDIGAILGKSEDQAAKYAEGTAEMGLVAFARAKREWNGRFTGYVDRLCVDSRPGNACDRTSVNAVLGAAMALNVALEDDNAISAAEVRDNRAALEAARDAIEAQLAKAKPEQVA